MSISTSDNCVKKHISDHMACNILAPLPQWHSSGHILVNQETGIAYRCQADGWWIEDRRYRLAAFRDGVQVGVFPEHKDRITRLICSDGGNLDDLLRDRPGFLWHQWNLAIVQWRKS